MEEMLGLVSLSSATARRETLVAPALFEVAHYCQCQVSIEYPLQVSAWLRGNLDYFLKRDANLLVVEAKNADLSRGFTQLAVELIAISEVEDGDIFYGAVTTGRCVAIWTARSIEPSDFTGHYALSDPG